MMMRKPTRRIQKKRDFKQFSAFAFVFFFFFRKEREKLFKRSYYFECHKKRNWRRKTVEKLRRSGRIRKPFNCWKEICAYTGNIQMVCKFLEHSLRSCQAAKRLNRGRGGKEGRTKGGKEGGREEGRKKGRQALHGGRWSKGMEKKRWQPGWRLTEGFEGRQQAGCLNRYHSKSNGFNNKK